MHLRGPRRRHARPRAHPLVVPPAARSRWAARSPDSGSRPPASRNGLPHESVPGDGRLHRRGRGRHLPPGDDLFDTFPNSYGSLGYATRLRIRLEQVPAYVALRHVRFDDAALLTEPSRRSSRPGSTTARGSTGSTASRSGEYYLTLATWTADVVSTGSTTESAESTESAEGTESAESTESTETSDYTGQQVFYRSVRERESDLLTIHDLWRWDTDWFWCSGAFGVQRTPVVQLWPRRWRPPDVYHRPGRRWTAGSGSPTGWTGGRGGRCGSG